MEGLVLCCALLTALWRLLLLVVALPGAALGMGHWGMGVEGGAQGWGLGLGLGGDGAVGPGLWSTGSEAGSGFWGWGWGGLQGVRLALWVGLPCVVGVELACDLLKEFCLKVSGGKLEFVCDLLRAIGLPMSGGQRGWFVSKDAKGEG